MTSATTPAAATKRTLPGTLLQHALDAPGAIFLDVWDERKGSRARVTYSELADCRLAASAFLQSFANAKHGDHVALLAPNSVGYLSMCAPRTDSPARKQDRRPHPRTTNAAAVAHRPPPAALSFAAPSSAKASLTRSTLQTR